MNNTVLNVKGNALTDEVDNQEKVSGFVDPTQKFVPTKAMGRASDKQKSMLMKEAPETMEKPIAKNFSSAAAYNEAVSKFNKYGNWASNK
jgi:hypothetical protein